MTAIQSQPIEPRADEPTEQQKRDDYKKLLVAAMFWDEADPEYRGMLTLNRGWTWDNDKQSFVSPHGSTLRQDSLRFLAIGLTDKCEHRIEAMTADMLGKKLDQNVWRDRVESLLSDENMALAMLAAGGIDGIDEDDIDDVWGREYEPGKPGTGLLDATLRLKDFVEEIRQNEAGEDHAVIQRAGTYAHYGYGTYERVRQNSHARAVDEDGKALFVFERNVLDPAVFKHCGDTEFTDGCIGVTEAGWQPIGTLTPVGTRTCNAGCRCWLEYRLVPDAEDLE